MSWWPAAPKIILKLLKAPELTSASDLVGRRDIIALVEHLA